MRVRPDGSWTTRVLARSPAMVALGALLLGGPDAAAAAAGATPSPRSAASTAPASPSAPAAPRPAPMTSPGTPSPAGAGRAVTDPAARALTPEDVVRRLNRANGALGSWRARFTQRRNFVHFNETESKSGTISFRRGSGLLIHILEPDEETIVVTGEKAMQWRPKTKQLHVFKLKGDQGTRDLSPIPFAFGDAGFDPFRDHVVRLLDATGGGEVALELKPRAEGTVYVRKVLWLDPKTWLPAKLQLTESTDDVVHFAFTEVELDPKLDPGDFVLKPPPGADVVEHTDLPTF